MVTMVILISACALPDDPHWAIGSWSTGAWSGVCLRPDGVVIERNPDGDITDVGRWSPVGDDAVVWTLVCTPTQETMLLRVDGGFATCHNYGSGYFGDPTPISRGHRQTEYESYVFEF